MTFDLNAVGVLAPGLGSLADLRQAARGERSLEVAVPLTLPTPDSLPANERRRASQVVRLALGCIDQALEASPFAADTLRSVFATDEGTGEVCQQMLELLVTTRQVSPMLFSNSVLNAPSGYFSIAQQNRQSATVVSAGVESFAGGLACAVTEATTTSRPVLLVAYDAAMRAPLDELLAIAEPTATAWIINAAPGDRVSAIATFELSFDAATSTSPTPLPSWLPSRWSVQSSARSMAALGLLEARVDAVYRCILGGQMLCLRRIAGERT